MDLLLSLYFLLLSSIFIDKIEAISIDIWPTSEHLLNQEAGQNLAVTCTTSSNKSNVQDIIWYKNGLENPIPSYGRIMASKVRHATTRLMLTGPKITDSGDYKCIVVLANGKMIEKSVKINFVEAINFENAPPEQHPTEGKDAKIICYVSGHPSIEIYWQFNGKNIIEGWPRGYEFKNKSQVLFIPKFKSAQDDGEYSCRATQFFSFKVRIINVTAYEPPQITVFEGSNQEYEGKDHKLMCQATGKPPPSYRWLKNTNGVETIIEQSQKYSVKNGLLVVKSLMPYDQGIYSCIASNALDTARFDHNLTIFRRPKIEMMKNETRSRGDLVELRCYFSGDGNITAKWIHNGEQWQAKTFDIAKYSAGGDLYAEDSRVFVRLEDGVSVLTIFSVQDDDAGQYQCVTENEAGTDQRSTYLAIIHAPTIIDRSDEIYVVNGGRAEMFCKAVAVPDPVWIWTGPENEIVDADGNLYIIDTISTTTKLIIEKVGETDFGNYKCTASNGIGDDNAQIDLHQIFIPNIPSEFHCDEIFPNYGICRIDDYVDMDRAHRPTHLNFIYEKDQSPGEQKKIYNITLPYRNKNEFKIENLEPKSKYLVWISALNEAGASRESQPQVIETTIPWAPEAPSDVRYNCLANCDLIWKAPNDFGSPITAYKLFIREMKNKEEKEYVDEGQMIQLHSNDLKIDLSFLKPLSIYEVKLLAVNSVGESSAYSLILDTPELSDYRIKFGNIGTWRIFIYALICLMLLFVFIDIACCFIARCGLTAYIFFHCLANNINSTKQRDNDHSVKIENNKLLEKDELNKGCCLRSNTAMKNDQTTQSTSV